MGILNISQLRYTALICASTLVLAGCGTGGGQQTETSPTTEATAITATASPQESTASEAPSPAASSTLATPTVTEITQEPAPEQVGTESETPQVVESTNPTQLAQQTESDATSAGTPTCKYGQIHIAAQVADGGGAAGSRYINLTFTNSGSSPCTIGGYPSVNYVDSSGNQIGSGATHAAEWTSSSKVLEPGGGATAILRETRANLYDAQTCQPTTAAGYRVTIPGTSSSFVLNFPAEACSSSTISQLSVGQVGAGSS